MASAESWISSLTSLSPSKATSVGDVGGINVLDIAAQVAGVPSAMDLLKWNTVAMFIPGCIDYFPRLAPVQLVPPLSVRYRKCKSRE